MDSAVAAATANYVCFFLTLSASINSLIIGTLNWRYSILVNIIAIIGSIPGIYNQGFIVRKSGGRHQFTVMIILSFILMNILVVIPMSVM